MKPHPRIHKTIKWGGAAVTVLLVVVWIGSGWKFIQWRSASGYGAAIVKGTIRLEHIDCMGPYQISGNEIGPGPYRGSRTFMMPFGWEYRAEKAFSLAWRFDGAINNGFGSCYVIPIWPFVLLSITVATLGWRSVVRADRLLNLGLCPKCGYDRTGLLKDAKCPECGAAPASN